MRQGVGAGLRELLTRGNGIAPQPPRGIAATDGSRENANQSNRRESFSMVKPRIGPTPAPTFVWELKRESEARLRSTFGSNKIRLRSVHYLLLLRSLSSWLVVTTSPRLLCCKRHNPVILRQRSSSYPWFTPSSIISRVLAWRGRLLAKRSSPPRWFMKPICGSPPAAV